MITLVTGGAGFIGSNLVQHIIKKNHRIIILDNFSSSKSDSRSMFDNYQNIEVFDDSIMNKAKVDELMSRSNLCFHLAASLGVERINKQAAIALETNIKGTEIVLKSAAKYGVKTLLASSSEIYGRNPIMPLHENSDRVLGSPNIARWTYSEAKAIDEFFAFDLAHKMSLQVVIARLFNTVGPRQSGQYGMVLPRFIDSALRNEPLIVYGDGSQTRSFCSVKDVAKALNLLINCDNAIGQVFNIGSNNEITISELANRVIYLTKSKSKIEFRPYSEIYGINFEEPMRRVPDISKILSYIDWHPTTDLDNLIVEIVDYKIKNDI